jgi:hypothetical protein
MLNIDKGLSGVYKLSKIIDLGAMAQNNDFLQIV